MPIFEYRCSECKRKFEQVVLRGKALDEAACPRCGSHAVERLMSTFALSGVSRKSEEPLDDPFDGGEDDLGDEPDGGDFGDEDELGDEELGGEGLDDENSSESDEDDKY